MLNWIRKVEMDEILQRGLLELESDFSRYMKEKYPLSWEDALTYTIFHCNICCCRN